MSKRVKIQTPDEMVAWAITKLQGAAEVHPGLRDTVEFLRLGVEQIQEQRDVATKPPEDPKA